MTPDELLTTTRAVRKRLDFDKPVPLEVIRECLEIAQQAPTASNKQDWHFVVVMDPEQRAEIAKWYKKAFSLYRKIPGSVFAAARSEVPDPRGNMERIAASAEYLAEHFEKVPALLIPCVTGRTDHALSPVASPLNAGTYGSIFPATWSFMLAARARGLGTALTTMHLMHEREIAQVLGIPYDQIMQTCLVTIGYTKGASFKKAQRLPLDSCLHIDDW